METPEEEFVNAEEHERTALAVRCKICGAPKGVGCAGLEWVAGDGQLTPVPYRRPHHTKRYKWAVRVRDKYAGVDRRAA